MLWKVARLISFWKQIPSILQDFNPLILPWKSVKIHYSLLLQSNHLLEIPTRQPEPSCYAINSKIRAYWLNKLQRLFPCRLKVFGAVLLGSPLCHSKAHLLIESYYGAHNDLKGSFSLGCKSKGCPLKCPKRKTCCFRHLNFQSLKFVSRSQSRPEDLLEVELFLKPKALSCYNFFSLILSKLFSTLLGLVSNERAVRQHLRWAFDRALAKSRSRQPRKHVLHSTPFLFTSCL